MCKEKTCYIRFIIIFAEYIVGNCCNGFVFDMHGTDGNILLCTEKDTYIRKIIHETQSYLRTAHTHQILMFQFYFIPDKYIIRNSSEYCIISGTHRWSPAFLRAIRALSLADYKLDSPDDDACGFCRDINLYVSSRLRAACQWSFTDMSSRVGIQYCQVQLYYV